jgi:hypothetical protein
MGVNCYPLWAQSRQPPSPASAELQIHWHYLLRQKTNIIIIIIIMCVSSKAKIETKNAYTSGGENELRLGTCSNPKRKFLEKSVCRIEQTCWQTDHSNRVSTKLGQRQQSRTKEPVQPPTSPCYSFIVRKEKSRTTLPDLPRLQHVK